MDPITLALVGAGAGIGALLGGLSTKQRQDQQQQQIRQRWQLERQGFQYQREYTDASFALQRGQAMDDLAVQHNRLAQAFKADLAGFNLGLEGQALGAQAARINLADNAGMAQAQQGMSGTRGSATLQRRLEYQQSSFDRQFDLQTRSNSLAIQNMTRQYTNQFDDIGREIDSWHSGYRAQAKELSDAYALRMHGLKMHEYDLAYQDAEATPLDYLSGILGGASQGASFGMQIAGLREQIQGRKAVDAIKTAVTGEGAAPLPQASLYQSDYTNQLGVNQSLFSSRYPPSVAAQTPDISFDAEPFPLGGDEWFSWMGRNFQTGSQEWAYMMTEALGGEIQVDPNGYLFNSHTMDWTFKKFGGPIEAVGWDPADVLYPGKTWNPRKGWM